MARYRSRRDREKSRRFWSGLVKAGLALALIGATAYYGYEVGTRLQAGEIEDLRAEIDRLSGELSEARGRTGALTAELREARTEATEYRQRYESVAPPEVHGIIAAAKDKIAGGLSPERLAFLVSQAAPPQDCADAQTRRFIARTENYDGPNTWVRFDEVITVSGRGVAGARGTAEWFDAERPITLTFTPIGREPQAVAGTLPLHHALVFKDKEYRFTAEPGPRGFVQVTADWCAYRPGGAEQQEAQNR